MTQHSQKFLRRFFQKAAAFSIEIAGLEHDRTAAPRRPNKKGSGFSRSLY
jgi:hypothetical protein